jgi:hypothetical protein
MGVASVKLTEVANRAGVHIPPSGATSLLRKRCFASSGRRLSGVVERVSKGFATGPMSPSRVGQTFGNGLAADTLFRGLLANLHRPSSMRSISTR